MGIENSKELRRNVLEASKMAVSILHSHHKIGIIRKQKDKTKEKLKENLNELNMLVKHLGSVIPKLGLLGKKGQIHDKMRKPLTELPEIKPKRKIDELVILDKQLDDLHKKLSSL